ncbi:nucleotide sugar dehydrogenase [Chloroflexota bacterium]
MKRSLDNVIVCIVGLGYVGLPLAKAFANNLKVIGFDVNGSKINKLTHCSENQNLTFTSETSRIREADFIIICVPTPVTSSSEPDLSHIKLAAKIISQNIKKGSVVILESTVYPGVTEEVLKPNLEESGLKCGEDFKIAYSPERINPGDEEHILEKVTKIVSGMDQETTELVSELYRKVTPHIFKAKDIKTAEAAKVIENIQRDLNIALVNELSLIFDKMGLNTKDILDAAATKWNFHHYSPGLVGGHCIPVDPYYLVYKARELGYHSQVILSGRAINDYMPEHIAEMTIKALNNAGKVIKGSKVIIMGLTYKENVADTRETPVKAIIGKLKEYGIKIHGFDPYLSEAEARKEFDIEFIDSLDHPEGITFDAIVITVAHEAFQKLKLDDLARLQNINPVLIDVRGVYNGEEAKQAGFTYKTL